jgi:pullulanase
MLRSKAGDHNSYASGDSVNMIRWENAARYREIVDYYAGLIRLRKAHPAFRQTEKAAIDQSLEITGAENLGVSFLLKGNANGDSWRTIFVAYNGSAAPKIFALPAAVPVWRQVVDAQRAGIETLGEVSGTVTLPPLSMAVLHE